MGAKLRILSLDWPLENKAISKASFFDDYSFDEYDVLIINPVWIDSWLYYHTKREEVFSSDIETYHTRSEEYHFVGKKLLSDIKKIESEIENILIRNGGILICKILPSTPRIKIFDFGGKSQTIDRYSFLPNLKIGEITAPQGYIRQIRLTDSNINFKSKKGTECNVESKSQVTQFFDAFKENIEFKAIVNITEDFSQFCEILAKNRPGEIIALELAVEPGKIILLPDLKKPDPKKEAGVLFDIISNIFGGPVDESLPPWISDYILPGEIKYDKEIKEIEDDIKIKNQKLNDLKREKYSITHFKALLWGTGKRVLEPVVREAFRLIGFKVPEPDEYSEAYDVLLYSDEGNAIAEVEGAEKQVDVTKFRQLLDYIEAEAEKNREFKGILVGNGFRQIDPKIREYQFTETARKRCISRGFCLISTYDLYKIIEKILSNPEDGKFKLEIRKRILGCTGNFSYSIPE